MDNQPGATRTMLTRGKSGRATRVRTGRTDSRKPGRAARDLGTDDIAIEEAVSLFCASHSNRGTARSYRAALTCFTGFCSSRGVASLGDVSPPLLTAYPASPVGQAAPTRWHRLVVLRAFLRWASRAGWCGAAGAEVIRPVAGRRVPPPPPWTVEECQRLLAAGESWRDRALVAVLVASGARIGEVVGSALGDFDGECLTLSGKTGTRAVPLGPRARSALNWYLRHRPQDPDAPLFMSRQGRLSTRQALDVVHLACRRARVAPRGAHAFRHAAATRWLRAGIPLPVVSAALGHARTSTTVDSYGLALAADLVRGLSADPLWAEASDGRPARPKAGELAA